MASGCAGVQAYRFEGFVLDLAREQLLGPRGGCVLRRKTFAVLHVLVEAAPALVTLDELLDRVWGRREVSPSVVANVIAELRRVLDDDARVPRCIETRHRRGYRMIAAVRRELTEAATVATPQRHDSALLGALSACVRDADGTREDRLQQLHRMACDRGLAFLAIEARLALQALGADVATAPQPLPA